MPPRSRRHRHPGLEHKEYAELEGIYISYYEVECLSVHQLRRMEQLEHKATDAQLSRLLAKYHLTLAEVFD